MALMFIIARAAHSKAREFFSIDGLFNGIGQILMVVFISLALATFSPFQCYNHPNDKSSLVQSPEVLCWETSDHIGMVVTSCLAVLCYPVLTSVMVGFVVWQYPRQILRHDVSFLNR